jgi:hypothetical protein
MSDMPYKDHPVARGLAAASFALSDTPAFSALVQHKTPWIPLAATAPPQIEPNRFAKVYLLTWRMEFVHLLPIVTDLVAEYLRDRGVRHLREHDAYDRHALRHVSMHDPSSISNHEMLAVKTSISRCAEALRIDLDAVPSAAKVGAEALQRAIRKKQTDSGKQRQPV